MVVNAATDEVEQENHYYPYGGLIGDLCTAQEEQEFKFGDKKLDRTYGLDLYDFEARQYDAIAPWFTSIDPLAEKYYSISPYAYCAGDPVNCVDPDGRILIPINGNHAGVKEKFYWDNQIIRKIQYIYGDQTKPLYYDGALGGVSTIFQTMGVSYFVCSPLRSINRYKWGYAQGQKDAEYLFSLKESIVILTHSMGAAYGKGYAQALVDYAKRNNIDYKDLISEIDVAPYQADEQSAVEGVYTYHISHIDDILAGTRTPMKNASESYLLGEGGHRLSSFEYLTLLMAYQDAERREALRQKQQKENQSNQNQE